MNVLCAQNAVVLMNRPILPAEACRIGLARGIRQPFLGKVIGLLQKQDKSLIAPHSVTDFWFQPLSLQARKPTRAASEISVFIL